jgi:hypothetical protein
MIESLDDDRNVDRIEDPDIAPLTFGMLRGHMSDMKALSRPGLIPPTPPPNRRPTVHTILKNNKHKKWCGEYF